MRLNISPNIAIDENPPDGFYIVKKGSFEEEDKYLHQDGIWRDQTWPFETGYFRTFNQAEELLKKLGVLK